MLTCPNIFLKHVKEIEKMYNSEFTESEFAKLRLRQKFEISTFNLITHILKPNENKKLLGSELIGKTTLMNSPKKNLTCNILAPHFSPVLEILIDIDVKFTFKSIQKLDYFYGNFHYTPMPIILCPEETIEVVRDFSSSCFGFLSCTDESVYVFVYNEYEMIVMEPYVALNFGLKSSISEIIEDVRINTFYFGFIYRKHI